MGLIFLYETTAVNGAGVEQPVRFSTGDGYSGSGSPGFFESRIVAAGNFGAKQSIFADRRSFGFGGKDYDYIELANIDGELDEMVGWGYGRPATVKMGDDKAAYSTFQTVMQGAANQILPGLDSLKIGWRERAEELSTPLQEAFFGGTNSGQNGLEGTAADIGGLRKPYAGGRVKNLAPILLNASTRIMGWRWSRSGSRLSTAQITAVRVSGNGGWSSIGNFASASLLNGAEPEFGEYATCLAESLIKIGGSFPLPGVVAIDVNIESTMAQRYAGAQIRQVLNHAGVSDARIDLAALAATDTIRPYEVGFSVTNDDARTVLDALMASVLVCGWVDDADVYRFRFIKPLASETPVATFRHKALTLAEGEAEVTALSGVFSGNSDKDVPIYRAQVTYGHNALVLSADTIADAVSAEEAAALSQPYRTTAPADNHATLARFPNAGALVHDTLLTEQAAAEEVRNALLSLLSSYRLTLQLQVALTPSLAALLAPGAVVRVEMARYGMDSGRLGQVLSYAVEANTKLATLEVWMMNG